MNYVESRDGSLTVVNQAGHFIVFDADSVPCDWRRRLQNRAMLDALARTVDDRGQIAGVRTASCRRWDAIFLYLN